MKVEVYTRSVTDRDGKQIRSKLIWRGELQQIPRVGELISVHGDFCFEEVDVIYWFLPKNKIEIFVSSADHSDAYPSLTPDD